MIEESRVDTLPDKHSVKLRRKGGKSKHTLHLSTYLVYMNIFIKGLPSPETIDINVMTHPRTQFNQCKNLSERP